MENRDAIEISGKTPTGYGLEAKHLYRSSAISPLITFIFIFSVVCLILIVFKEMLWITFVWIVVVSILAAVFVYFIKTDPNVMRSEEFNLELKKIELGEKDKPLGTKEQIQIVQPIAVKKRLGTGK